KIGYNEEGGKEDFAAWEDEMEAYYENYGSETGVETAHNYFADTKNEEVEDKKYVKEG
ncbi:hypothetical protein Tco_1574536, partial [Tanacetum coccineum]